MYIINIQTFDNFGPAAPHKMDAVEDSVRTVQQVAVI